MRVIMTVPLFNAAYAGIGIGHMMPSAGLYRMAGSTAGSASPAGTRFQVA
jgi:hypothetical protein